MGPTENLMESKILFLQLFSPSNQSEDGKKRKWLPPSKWVRMQMGLGRWKDWRKTQKIKYLKN